MRRRRAVPRSYGKRIGCPRSLPAPPLAPPVSLDHQLATTRQLDWLRVGINRGLLRARRELHYGGCPFFLRLRYGRGCGRDSNRERFLYGDLGLLELAHPPDFGMDGFLGDIRPTKRHKFQNQQVVRYGAVVEHIRYQGGFLSFCPRRRRLGGRALLAGSL